MARMQQSAPWSGTGNAAFSRTARQRRRKCFRASKTQRPLCLRKCAAKYEKKCTNSPAGAWRCSPGASASGAPPGSASRRLAAPVVFQRQCPPLRRGYHETRTGLARLVRSTRFRADAGCGKRRDAAGGASQARGKPRQHARSEEHTSELQSHHDLVCRLLLEKKKKKKKKS